jgi:hypothetical protein
MRASRQAGGINRLQISCFHFCKMAGLIFAMFTNDTLPSIYEYRFFHYSIIRDRNARFHLRIPNFQPPADRKHITAPDLKALIALDALYRIYRADVHRTLIENKGLSFKLKALAGGRNRVAVGALIAHHFARRCTYEAFITS